MIHEMKRNLFFILSVLLTAAVSCDPDSNNPTPTPTPVPDPDPTPVKKELSVSVTGIPDGSTFGFFAKDPVNLSNVKMTVRGSSAVASQTLYWAENQTASSDFAAYSPYADGAGTGSKYDFKVREDQSDPADFKASDLIVAGNTVSPGQTVNLEFEHVLSKVSFSITNNLPVGIASVRLGNVATHLSVDFSSYTVKASGGPSSVNCDLTAGADDTYTCTMIIPSQKVRPVFTVVSESGKEYSFEPEDEKDFPSNSQVAVTLEVNPETLVVGFNPTILDWEEGWSVPVSQDVSSLKELSLSEFLNLPAEDKGMYRIAGRITKVTDNVKGSFILEDGFVTVPVASLLSSSLVPSVQFTAAGLKEGDFLRVYCRHGDYAPLDGKVAYITHAIGLNPEPAAGEIKLWEGVLDLNDKLTTVPVPEFVTSMIKPGGAVRAYLGAVFNDFWTISIYSPERLLIESAYGTSAVPYEELILTESNIKNISRGLVLTGNGVIGMLTYSATEED